MNQRIIKFRVWDFDTKKMYYKTGLMIGNNSVQAVNGIVSEFIGIVDKNEVEVYEHDIVRWFDNGVERTGRVLWQQHSNGFRIPMSVGYMPSIKLTTRTIEVIGNIFEDADIHITED